MSPRFEFSVKETIGIYVGGILSGLFLAMLIQYAWTWLNTL